MLKNKKMIVIISTAVIMVVAVIIIAVILLNKNKEKQNEYNNVIEESIDREKLEMEFKQPFSNNENEYVEIRQEVEQAKVGKYDVTAKIPKITIEEAEAEELNQEIYRLAASIINQATKADKYVKYDMEYITYLNRNVLSIVIRFTIKEGANPRRIIIKTYNYDIVENKQVKITDIIDREKENKIQEEINNKIEESNIRANQSISKGYTAYVRETESKIYKIENATEFFIGNDNILYIIYAYGNQDYTDEMDLIMYKL